MPQRDDQLGMCWGKPGFEAQDIGDRVQADLIMAVDGYLSLKDLTPEALRAVRG
ncbi:hypothetical protein GCM10027088_20680 [Nocardia goodfellowii]